MQQKVKEFNQNSIMVKVLKGRLNLGTLRHDLEQLWDPVKPNDIQLVPKTNDIFQIRFPSKEFMEFVMMNQPWMASGHLLQIIPWMEYNNGNTNFSQFLCWFQLMNYPEIYLEPGIIMTNLYDSDFFDDGKNLLQLEIYRKEENEPQIVRVKAIFGVDDPLPPGIHVPISFTETEWVQFSYEGIPTICFKCGKLGHVQSSCTTLMEIKKEAEDQEHKEISKGAEELFVELYNTKSKTTPAKIAGRRAQIHFFPNGFDDSKFLARKGSAAIQLSQPLTISQWLSEAHEDHQDQMIVDQGFNFIDANPVISEPSPIIMEVTNQDGSIQAQSGNAWINHSSTLAMMPSGTQITHEPDNQELQEQFNLMISQGAQLIPSYDFSTIMAVTSQKESKLVNSQEISHFQIKQGGDDMVLQTNEQGMNCFKRAEFENPMQMKNKSYERAQMQEHYAGILFEERQPRRKIQNTNDNECNSSGKAVYQSKKKHKSVFDDQAESETLLFVFQRVSSIRNHVINKKLNA